MIEFLLKGILRDKSRSLLPIIIISIGVMLSVSLSAYVQGSFNDIVDQNAIFDTGHVKIMSRAYALNKDQAPNDLALLGVDTLLEQLKSNYPQVDWVSRIKFGGLIDVPDTAGNTRAQGPVSGMAIDLLSANSSEIDRLKIRQSIVKGQMPKQANEIIIGHSLAQKLDLNIGDEFTYFGTTMEGSMSFQTLRLAATVRFGTAAMDKGALMMDIKDAQLILDMQDGAGELLGYLANNVYDDHKSQLIRQAFNEQYHNSKDEFAPEMFTLREQNNLGSYLDYGNTVSSVFVFLFILAMSIVLWNTGLLGGLRRYQEFGIRLALGESKGQIYRSMLIEAAIIGSIGSVVGTCIGLAFSYYLQEKGFDISSYIKNASMIMPSVIRSKITPSLFYIGFIPGLLAMLLGTMLAGRGIYKRETARLFKELEV